MRLARFARTRLLRHALPISLLILREKPTVLQSTYFQSFALCRVSLEAPAKEAVGALLYGTQSVFITLGF